MHIIGKGGFGKVWKVRDKKYKIEFALKEIQKVKVIDKKSENSIKREKELLQILKHPFIVNMHCAFQDFENLYLVMDLLTGGDLRYHISRKKKFNETISKFFIGCILLGLRYIHSKNIIHRDIKPENLVLDDSGYVHITDFGIAKYKVKNNSNETSGTPGYMSPEVLRGQNHSFSVDFFAVGVIAYEFMFGRRPYVGKSRKEIKEQVMAKQVQIKAEELPEGWSLESADFINKLLQRKPENRLGSRDIKEIFEHPWFNKYSWDNLFNHDIYSPYIPEKKDNFDKRYCEGIEKVGVNTLSRYEEIVNNTQFQYAFQNFTFYGNNRSDSTNQYNEVKLPEEKKKESSNPHITLSLLLKAKKRCNSALSNGINIIESINPAQIPIKFKMSSIKNDLIKIPMPQKFTSSGTKATSNSKAKIRQPPETSSGSKTTSNGAMKNRRMKSDNLINYSTITKFNNNSTSTSSNTQTNSYIKTSNSNTQIKRKNVTIQPQNTYKEIYRRNQINDKPIANSIGVAGEKNALHHKSISSHYIKFINTQINTKYFSNNVQSLKSTSASKNQEHVIK